jgi:hypothetical protein
MKQIDISIAPDGMIGEYCAVIAQDGYDHRDEEQLSRVFVTLDQIPLLIQWLEAAAAELKQQKPAAAIAYRAGTNIPPGGNVGTLR